MNKTAIKNFAIWARNKLIASCEQKALMVGITEDGIADKLDVSTVDTEFYDIGTSNPYSISGKAIKQRRELVKAIQNRTENGDYKSAFHSIMEEVAYTWFNRLIALRFMEVNGYLKDDMRILSSASEGKVEPDAVTSPFDWELEFSDEERDHIIQLQNNNKVDELFRLLFIKECNALNVSLPYLFEKTEDYSEFLLSISVTDVEGVVYKLVHDIPEEDFNIEMGGQVEIIGWLYQYYNTEPKDKVFADLKKNIKVTKDKIPAATQLFTPDWIVRYMVENSLGRIWIEKKAFSSGEGGAPCATDEVLAKSFNWKYYLPEAAQDIEIKAQLQEIRQDRRNIQPEDIKVIDPCMGSGHILVYAFDVLMDIYRENGYVDRDAAQSIIKNNLYGLDIDQRAFQLAYFAVMMKGRQYDKRIFTRNIEPNLCAIEDSNDLAFPPGEGGPLAVDEVSNLITLFHDAKEYGSILNVPAADYDKAIDYIEELKTGELDLITAANIELLERKLPKLVKQAKIMAAKYDVVVTNPPYMGGNNMNSKLSAYVKKHYPDSKSDMFACLIEKCMVYTQKAGYTSMITMQSWMFLSSFEELRKKILQKQISSLIQIGYNSFPEINSKVAQAVAFIIQSEKPLAKGTYLDLNNKYPQAFDKEKAFESEKENGYYVVKQENFSKIPGSPVAYWVSENIYSNYNNAGIGNIVVPRHGLATSDNDRFLKMWNEVDINKGSFITKCEYDKKWFPMNKGGNYRKWYGNLNWVINYADDGKELKDYATELYKSSSRTIQNTQFYFKEGITWSALTSGALSFRYSDIGAIFGSGGHCAFTEKKETLLYALGLMNSKVNTMFLNIVSATMNKNVDDIRATPFIQKDEKIVASNVARTVALSKADWDSFETSWDFVANPLVAAGTSFGTSCHLPQGGRLLSDSYEAYKIATNSRFAQLKANEEELNRIFIDIYGLGDELTPEVADKDVTVASIFDTKDDIPESYKGNNYVLTKEDVIKNLISYAVGCLFGRYSLNKPGLIYAGGDWDRISKESFSEADLAKGIPDNDNVIPITDEAYFEDDITGRFIFWLKEAFGAENLEDNLAFIADALSVKGDNSRDVIRNYFLSGFYADHVKKYQKRPIYWLYDSGKNNGFKALIYMHRYDADTTGRVRMDYLHRMEQIYGDEINRVTSDIQESTEAREKAKLQKRLSKLEKQVKECREYDESIGHLALERIAIDLDDGVKVNYEKVQTDRNGNIYKILGKI